MFAQELEKHLNRITGTGVITKNAGGTIPGTGSSDTVRAMLTPGEFVINKAATAQNLPLLRDINKNGATQKFAKGGMVQGRGKIHRFRNGGDVPQHTRPTISSQAAYSMFQDFDEDGNDILSDSEANKFIDKYRDDNPTGSFRTAQGWVSAYRRAGVLPENTLAVLGIPTAGTSPEAVETRNEIRQEIRQSLETYYRLLVSLS